jgi:hypothetical protein
MDPDETNRLLTEIRDVQRALAEAHGRFSSESLTLQREALELQKQALDNQRRAIEEQSRSVAMQVRFGRLYRIVLIIAAAIIAYMVYRMLRYG